MTNQLPDYYKERAEEYDAVYAKPERQDDLRRLRMLLPPLVAGRRVLEVAAGTGYWTRVLSESAASIVATDLNDETLAVARQRTYGAAEVTFATADAYDLAAVEGVFDVVFAGFFWSHVLRADAARFARTLTERVAAGGMVVLVDNLYVAGSSSPITRTTASGDTYQTRRLTNGRQFEVLKNFPERTDLVDAFGPEVEWTDLTYFWLATAG